MAAGPTFLSLICGAATSQGGYPLHARRLGAGNLQAHEVVERLGDTVAVEVSGEPDVATDITSVRGVLDDVDVAEGILGQVVGRVQDAGGRREANVLGRLSRRELAHDRLAIASISMEITACSEVVAT